MGTTRHAVSLVTALLMVLGVVAVAPAAGADPNSTTVTIAGGDSAALDAALLAADSDGTPDVISLAANSTYTLGAVDTSVPTASPTGLHPVQGTDGQPITIDGNGATIERSSVAGTAAFRILAVSGGGNLTLDDVTISNGDAEIGSDGGGIFNAGTLAVVRSTIASNIAARNGGGIYDTGAVLHVTDSTIDGNVANGTGDAFTPVGGGGVFTSNGGDKSISNTTITANRAPNGDGGNVMGELAPVTIENCTLTDGSALLGSGLGSYVGFAGDPIPTVGTSIIADNGAAAGNVNAADGNVDPGAPSLAISFVSQGYNIIGASPDEAPETSDPVAGEFSAPGDQNGGQNQARTAVVGVDPLLAPLADNGGPTQTQAPRYASPAIDAGDSSATTDQRGLPRPVDLADQANVANASDIGAVELQTEPPASLVVTTAVDEDNGNSDPSLGTGTSLREAVNYAQQLPRASTITFAVPGSAVVLNLSSPLLGGDNVSLDNGDGSHPVTIQASPGHFLDYLVRLGGVATVSGLTFSNPGGAEIVDDRAGRLTIKDSTVSHAGRTGVISEANLTVEHSTFTGNARGAIQQSLEFGGPGSAVVDDSTFTDNTSPSGGGAIDSDAPVTVSNSTFTGNTAGSGGAIYMAGGNDLLTVSNSTFTGNTVSDGGGAIQTGVYTTVDTSTFTGNTAGSGGGGAINAYEGGATTVTNSTLTGNSTTGPGGALYIIGQYLHLASDTITTNTAPTAQGGGVFTKRGQTDLHDSIAVGNTGDDLDTDMPTGDFPGYVSDGYNLIGTGNGVSVFTGAGDVTGVSDAKLGPLADNGGPTQTQTPLPGSPAVDTGDPASCPATDQRGITRPQGPRCDIGAVEVKIGPPALITPTSGSGQSANTQATFGAPLVATVTDAAGFAVASAAVTYAVTSGSATFAGGHASATVTTDTHGVATSPVLAAGTAAGPVIVTASTANLTGANAADYLETVTATGPAKADLSVRLTAPSTVRAGGTFTTTLTVTNTGPNAAGRYAAALLIPRTLSITAANGGTRFRLGVIFTGSGLASGKSVNYPVTLRAGTAKGSTAFGATALSQTHDPNPRNNITAQIIKIQ